jgi:hypothetical protein
MGHLWDKVESFRCMVSNLCTIDKASTLPKRIDVRVNVYLGAPNANPGVMSPLSHVALF